MVVGPWYSPRLPLYKDGKVTHMRPDRDGFFTLPTGKTQEVQGLEGDGQTGPPTAMSSTIRQLTVKVAIDKNLADLYTSAKFHSVVTRKKVKD